MTKSRRQKNRIRTNNRRTLRRALPRFFSLMIMSLLGTLVFSGLMATAPDMLTTLDTYLDDNHVYDIKVISDMGLEEADIEALAGLSSVETAEGVKSLDLIASWKAGEFDTVINVSSLPQKLNTIEVLSGRLPEKAGEIIIEGNFLEKEGLALGDSLHLDSDSLKEQDLTIVGTCDSPLYYNNVMINQDRGNTSVGSGKISYFSYISEENFDLEVDTAVYLTVRGGADLLTSGEEYDALIETAMDQVEAITPEREKARYDSVYAEAEAKIDKARSDADKELKEAKDKLDDAKKDLADAKKELAENKAKLDEAKASLDSAKATLDAKEAELAEARTSLDSAKTDLNTANNTLISTGQDLQAAKKTLDENKASLDSAKTTLDAKEAELEKAGTSLDEAKEKLEKTKDQLSAAKLQLDMMARDPISYAGIYEEALAAYEKNEADYEAGLSEYETDLDQYEQAKTDLAEKKKTYESHMADYESGLEEYNKNLAAWQAKEAEYEQGQASYQASETAYAEGQTALQSGRAEYEQNLAAYEDSYAEYEKGLADYEEGRADYKEGVADYKEAKADADREIEEAREKLSDIAMPTWYAYDRTGYQTYNDYVDDSNSIRNLGTLFPVMFFAVAVLVSLISMNRMVEEDRLEIGTLKSLGFSDGAIMTKYVTFSLSATIVGSILGSAIGLVIIPNLIFYIYRILFTLPSLVLTLQPFYTLLGFLITVLCVSGTGVLTALKVLREKPSELMRGKAPRPGKKILLEKLTFIWKRFSFSSKVTIRNLFRYKKRVLITIGGIAGCAALMLTGFGIRDAIVDIPSLQYYGIYQFDGLAYVSEDEGDALENISANPAVLSAVKSERKTAEIEGIDGFFMAVEPDDLSGIAAFTDAATGEKLALGNDGVIIDQKLSAMTGLGVGDEISLTDVDNKSLTLPIAAVAKNYIEHYVYMSVETLEKAGLTYRPNMVYFKTGDLTEGQKETLSESLLSRDGVLSVVYRSTLIDNVDKSLTSLNFVVLLLIVLSAMLDFVVLYNLSNINITERRREIATLKVLGFYDKEVDRYINRETVIMTVLGIGLGLVLGIVLSHMVVGTIEIEKARFVNELKALSFVYTAAMTALFTLIVSLITHINLKRIDMIDSLKSVE